MPVVYQWHACVCVQNLLTQGSLVLEDLPYHTKFSRQTKCFACTKRREDCRSYKYTHTHTYIYIYIYDWAGCVVSSTDVSNEPGVRFIFTPRSFKTSVTICQLIRRYNPEALIFKILSLLMIRAFGNEARPWNTRCWTLALFFFCFVYVDYAVDLKAVWGQDVYLQLFCFHSRLWIQLMFPISIYAVHRHIFVVRVRNVDHAYATYIVKYSTGESLVFIFTNY